MKRDERQARMGQLVTRAFGAEALANRLERAARLMEEATEVAQSLGLSPERAEFIVRHVYAQEPGDIAHEIGGLGVTLLALCESRGLSADEMEQIAIEHLQNRSVTELKANGAAKKAARISLVGEGTKK